MKKEHENNLGLVKQTFNRLQANGFRNSDEITSLYELITVFRQSAKLSDFEVQQDLNSYLKELQNITNKLKLMTNTLEVQEDVQALVDSANVEIKDAIEELPEHEQQVANEIIFHVDLSGTEENIAEQITFSVDELQKKLEALEKSSPVDALEKSSPTFSGKMSETLSDEGLSATLKKFISNVKEILKNFISSIRQLFTKDAPIELRGEEVHSQIMKEEKEDLGAHHVSKVHQEYSPMHYSKGNDKISESGAVMGHKERFDEYKSKVKGAADQSDKHEISQGSKYSTRFPEDDTKLKGPR